MLQHTAPRRCAIAAAHRYAGGTSAALSGMPPYAERVWATAPRDVCIHGLRPARRFCLLIYKTWLFYGVWTRWARRRLTCGWPAVRSWPSFLARACLVCMQRFASLAATGRSIPVAMHAVRAGKTGFSLSSLYLLRGGLRVLPVLPDKHAGAWTLGARHSDALPRALYPSGLTLRRTNVGDLACPLAHLAVAAPLACCLFDCFFHSLVSFSSVGSVSVQRAVPSRASCGHSSASGWFYRTCKQASTMWLYRYWCSRTSLYQQPRMPGIVKGY